jgi:hypothetical protein
MLTQVLGEASTDLRRRGLNPEENPFMAALQDDSAFRADYLVMLKNMVRSRGDLTEFERLMKTLK